MTSLRTLVAIIEAFDRRGAAGASRLRRARGRGLRGRGLRCWVAAASGTVLATAGLVVPFSVTAAAVVTAPAAKAAAGSVLILSTSVNGGSASAEAKAVPSGYSVTVATPATWDAMTTAQFKTYSALIIGDPSTATCATSVPADALSTAATWGAAVTGNVALLGTAPALAGSAGTPLISGSVAYALAGSGTGLYVSLNCEYSTAAAATAIPLLAHVDGGGFTATGQSASCPNSGTVNTWEAAGSAGFGGLASSALSSWGLPACSVQETMNAWPAGFTPVGYDKAATPANFTASNGVTGQSYVLLGSQVSAATAALAPSTGGEVPEGATAGGTNPAAPAVAQGSAGDPVNTENGDFSQSATDLAIPTFGPALTFTRTYDALIAQDETRTGTPGQMGYGWTGSWSSSLSAARPVPGDIYTIDGLATDNGDNGPAKSGVLSFASDVWSDSTGLYIADSDASRIQEVPATTGTQWGIAMTAGDVYTIAGSATGASGDSGNGTAMRSALLSDPLGLLVSSGNLYIVDSGNNRVLEIPGTSGTQRGISMTAGDIYTIAGHANGTSGTTGDGGAATSAFLDEPIGIATGSGTSDIYIADTDNNRIQEVAAATGSQWGQSMTANDIYTVVGNSAGNGGTSGNGVKGTSALLFEPQGVRLSGTGDVYVADTGNNRVLEMAKATGTQWAISMTANDEYTVAGSSAGTSGHTGNGGKATSALLSNPTGVEINNGTQLYITDSGNNRIQEVARTTHTEWGIAMTANDIYTMAGSATGGEGFSGDGGKATSADLDTPAAVALDSSLNMYILDTYNQRLREVSASTADISTVAGNGLTLTTEGNGGPAVTAAVFNPDEVASDSMGDIFVADAASNRIQEIAATSHTQFGIAMTAGDVYTVAGNAGGTSGTSGDGGPAASSLLEIPIGLALDSAGDLYIADTDNNRIQKVSAATGDISTVAGSAVGNSGTSGDGGAATSALLNMPWGLAVDSLGDLYIADEGNSRIQEVFAAGGEQWAQHMTAGDIYTVAGSSAGTFGDSGNGGVATSARLGSPGGVTVDAAGNLYISDSVNNQVREVAAKTGPHWGQQMTASDIYTVAGNAAGTSGTSGDGGQGTAALLSDAIGVTSDSAGDIFIADAFNDRIQEIAAADGTQWGQSMTAGSIYTVAGQADGSGGDSSGDGGPATSAVLDLPFGIAVDPSGDLFLTDEVGNLIREVTSSTATAIEPAPGQVSWLSPAPGGITVTQPGGSQVTFYAQSGGNCAAPYVKAGGFCALPQDTGATLTFNSGNSTYTFSPAPGSAYTYTSSGQLTSETDSAGNTLTLTYGSPAPGAGNCPATASSCNTVTSASGRALTIGTTPAGLITSVTDPMGREWAYGYTGSELTRVTDPMGNITTYTYGAGSTGNPLNANDLLTMTSPNAQPGGPDAGDATVNVYNAAGQVTSQTDPAGFKTTFSYCVNTAAGDCMNAATGTGYVTVTDPDGNTTVDYYVQGALAAESNVTGSTPTSEEDFFPDVTAGGTSGGTLADTAIASGNGNVTSYAYDGAGNNTSETGPDGIGSATGTSTAQFTSLNQASCAGTVRATSACSPGETGPAPVAPGGVITPPASAPPSGVTYTLYDTDGNELYATAGVYEPGGATAAYSQTDYQLFKGNSVTLGGITTSCAAVPPSASLPCARIDADGVVTQLAYNSSGDLTSSSTPDGNGAELAKSTYTYDGDGEQQTAVSPDGNLTGANPGNYTTTTAYDADGQESSVTLGGGTGFTDTPRAASYGYDGDENLRTVKDPRGFTTTTVYTADDKPALVTDPDGNATLTCYDSYGNVAQTVPPAGVAANSLTAASCPASYPAGYAGRLATDATTYTYNANGQKTAVTTPAPAGQTGSETTAYAYDGDGNLVTTTAPATSAGGPAQVTSDTYNDADELATQITGSGTSAAATTSYCHDLVGDTTSVVPGDGNSSGTATCETSSPYVVSATSFPTQAAYQTTYSSDSAGELVSTTAPATTAAPSGATSTSAYDPAGNMLTRTDPNAVTTTWTYTPLNLAATVSYSGSSAHSVSYTYDANGNQTGMTDATGTSSEVYDPFGELTSAKNGAGQVTGYGYNVDGQVSGITYPLPATATWAATDTVSYGYDNADLLTSVTDFNNHQITVGNTADGLPKSLALGASGDTVSTTYDPADVPSLISLKNATSTLQSFAYSDSPAGTVLSETDTPAAPNSPATYTYDTDGRVTSMTPGTGATLSYGFDPSWNLTALPNGAAGTYDRGSELTSAVLSGTTASYTYNADGERLTGKQGGSTIISGSWNGAGELTSYDNAAADLTAATYDGNGVRAATTTTGAGSQAFVWNTGPDVPELIMDSSSAYLYAGGTTPAEQVSLSSGTISYLVADSLGSVRGTVNSAGGLTATTGYDAWGNPQTAGGLTGTTPFGFSGGYTDPDGLIYLLNRYYDPATGQFLSVDPAITQTLQAYAYANDNPVSLTDPTGQAWWAYNTFRKDSRLSEDIDYDFSAHLTTDMAKVGEAAKTAGEFVAALALILQGVMSHANAESIAELVGGILIVVGMSVKAWRAVVKRFKPKGKHAKAGFWSRTFEDIFNQYYESSEARSCAAETIKCGSPGSFHIH